MRTSRRPACPSTDCTHSCTLWSEVTSRESMGNIPELCSGARLVPNTSNPRSARRAAIDFPMPREAAVIKTTGLPGGDEDTSTLPVLVHEIHNLLNGLGAAGHLFRD